jgi:hypothetical protein
MQGIPKRLDVVKCVRDLRGYPPSFYRMGTDGRKWFAACKDRKMLAMHLATYADGDGTNITVGIERLRQEMGWSKRTLYYLLADLVLLGILENDTDELAAKRGKLTGRRGTRLRHINWEGVWERAAQGVPDSVKECRIGNFTGVHDSDTDCMIAPQGLHDTNQGLHDSYQGVQQTADFGPRPYTDPPTANPDRAKNLPPKAEQQMAGMEAEASNLGALPQTPALPAQADPEDDDSETDEPDLTAEQIKADEAKWAVHEWELFMSRLPEAMHGAVMNADQRVQVAAQIDRYSFETVLAALRRWIEVRRYPVEECKTAWRAWLTEGDAAIAWVRREAKRQRLKEKSNGR